MTYPPKHPRKRIRIVNRTDIVTNARLQIISYDADGNEIGCDDITEELKITNFDISLRVGEIARVRIDCLAAEVDTDVRLVEFTPLGRPSRMRDFLRRLRP